MRDDAASCPPDAATVPRTSSTPARRRHDAPAAAKRLNAAAVHALHQPTGQTLAVPELPLRREQHRALHRRQFRPSRSASSFSCRRGSPLPSATSVTSMRA